MAKVMAKCVWAHPCAREFTVGNIYPADQLDDALAFSTVTDDGRETRRLWDGTYIKFGRIEGFSETTIEEMLGVVEAAGADTAVAATQALHAAGYHK